MYYINIILYIILYIIILTYIGAPPLVLNDVISQYIDAPFETSFNRSLIDPMGTL